MQFSTGFTVQVLEPWNIMEEFGVLLVHPENTFFIALSTLSLFSLSLFK